MNDIEKLLVALPVGSPVGTVGNRWRVEISPKSSVTVIFMKKLVRFRTSGEAAKIYMAELVGPHHDHNLQGYPRWSFER